MREIELAIGGDATEEELRRRLRELAAVYRMAETAASAETLDAVLEEAADVLIDALGADRSAVLLRDDEGVMRFRAWRGLSDAYRAAADGHSPWTGDEEEYEPIAIADVAAEPERADDLRRTILGEGIRALAFVPLVHRRELIGTFMLYADAPRTFAAGELQLAQTVGSTIAGATRRAHVEHALRESRQRLEVVLQRVADGITVQLPNGELVFANDAAAKLIGVGSVDELFATPFRELMVRFELFDEEERPLALEDLPGRAALRGVAGERVVGYRHRETGELRWSHVSATPVLAPDGEVAFAVNVLRDVTEGRRQEESLRFLARAGEVLAESLAYARTLAEVARLAVPAIADWAMVYVEDEGGEIRRIAVEHFAGLHEGLLDTLEQFPFDPDAEVGVPAVVRTGRAQLHAHADAALVAADVFDGERLAAQVDGLGIRSWMCLPLTARGRTFGAMSFLSTESGRIFDERDLELAGELARRAALAVDNARLYGQMEESVALLDAFLASAPVGIGFWDTDLRYVRVNATLAELNGMPAEDHVGRTLAEVIPDFALVLEPIYRRVLETGEPYLHEESTEQIPQRLGQDRHWLSRYFPVRARSGAIIGLGAVISEITDRKRAEKEREQLVRALDEQRALLEAVLRQMPSGVVVAEAAEGRIVLANEQVDQIWRGRFEVGRRAEEYPEYGGFRADGTRLERAEWPLSRAVSTGEEVVGEEIDVERLDGTRGTIDVSAAPVRDPAGAIVAGVATFTDVTERRAARDRLRFLAEASELLGASLDYETTLRNVADLAGTRVADWMLVYLLGDDGSLTQIVGRHGDPEKDELLRRLTEDPRPTIVPSVIESRQPVLIEAVDEDLLRQAAHGDEERLALLRRVGFTSAIVVPLAAGERVLGALAFALADPGRRYGRDDLELAEEIARRAALAIENARLFGEAEARARAAQALEFVGDGVFMLDHAGVVRLWNPAAELITGIRGEDVVGVPADLAIPGWASLGSRIPIVDARAGPASRPETLPLELGGRELWLSISGVGFEEGTVFAFRDVTEERGVEKLKSDFVSTISHELRTPLAAIYGAALTLRREDMSLAADQQEDLLGVIAAESERLAKIVNDILWTSRIEAGGLPVMIEACDPLTLAQGVLRAFAPSLPEQFRLDLDAAGDLPPLAADPDKVRQVLTNLVENAVKYSPGGGRIRVGVEALHGRVRFAVEDEGLGVPALERERVFEKFYRLDPNLARGVGGTGLGLYICRELVSRMGGRIWVEPKEGRGSTFVVELPATDDVAAHRF